MGSPEYIEAIHRYLFDQELRKEANATVLAHSVDGRRKVAREEITLQRHLIAQLKMFPELLESPDDVRRLALDQLAEVTENFSSPAAFVQIGKGLTCLVNRLAESLVTVNVFTKEVEIEPTRTNLAYSLETNLIVWMGARFDLDPAEYQLDVGFVGSQDDYDNNKAYVSVEFRPEPRRVV